MYKSGKSFNEISTHEKTYVRAKLNAVSYILGSVHYLFRFFFAHTAVFEKKNRVFYPYLRRHFHAYLIEIYQTKK